VVLATPWPEFSEIPPGRWARHSPARTVVDCWRALQQLRGVDGIQYVGLGTGALAEDDSAVLSEARSQGIAG
jgi:hypothetical protein